MTDNERMDRGMDPGAVVREALGPVPNDQVDWSGLHQRVMRAAVPALEARGVMVRWWEYLSRWAMPAAPIAAAAALALLLAFPMGSAVSAVEFGVLLNDGLTEAEAAVFWGEDDDTDVLLYAVFDHDDLR